MQVCPGTLPFHPTYSTSCFIKTPSQAPRRVSIGSPLLFGLGRRAPCCPVLLIPSSQTAIIITLHLHSDGHLVHCRGPEYPLLPSRPHEADVNTSFAARQRGRTRIIRMLTVKVKVTPLRIVTLRSKTAMIMYAVCTI